VAADVADQPGLLQASGRLGDAARHGRDRRTEDRSRANRQKHGKRQECQQSIESWGRDRARAREEVLEAATVPIRASVQSVIFLHILAPRHSVVEEVVGVARVVAKIVVSHAVKPVLA